MSVLQLVNSVVSLLHLNCEDRINSLNIKHDKW